VDCHGTTLLEKFTILKVARFALLILIPRSEWTGAVYVRIRPS